MKHTHMMALNKLAMMLEKQLGAGKVVGREFTSFTPGHKWTFWDRVRHFIYGYEPKDYLWRLDWDLNGFRCNTSLYPVPAAMDLDDIQKEYIEPTAAKMWQSMHRQWESKMVFPVADYVDCSIRYPKDTFSVAEFKYYPGLFPAEKD